MNSQAPVINVLGDYEETILQLAKHLGRDKNRRAVFNLIYGRGSKPKSKKQIAEALGKSGSAQVIQNALDELARHHLILRFENKGQVKDGSRWLYGKENSVRAHRDRIVRYADDPTSAKKIATKRRPALGRGISFIQPRARKAAPRGATPRRGSSAKRAALRIALLVTNPERRASLQTGVEARDIEAALKASGNWDQIDLKIFLAPTLVNLLDALNQFKPNVLHFSGHGGGGALLFDNERAGADGGTVLNFEMVGRVMQATAFRPDLLVLAACDTVSGADVFLSSVPAVVAMDDEIDDDAACDFSAQFYRSLASGASITNALTQAKLVLEHKGYADAQLPTLVSATGQAATKIFI
jgi:hypothetical protein